MASRADLIMAQVRGELAQTYRKKTDEGSIIDDITAGILGYQTGQEAMYAIEGAVKDFKTSYLQGEFEPDSFRGRMGERIYGKNVELKDLTREQRASAIGGDISFQPRIDTGLNMDEIANDFINSTSNVEMSNDGVMTKTKYKTFGPLNYQNDAYVNPYKLLNKGNK